MGRMIAMIAKREREETTRYNIDTEV